MQKTYSKEERAQYFQDLRERWQAAKELAQDNAILAAHKEAEALTGRSISAASFADVKNQLHELQLQGTPYVDTKTFRGWRDSGMQVRKGEKSKITGLTWIKAGDDDQDDKKSSYMFPKEYHLFHGSQVEPIE
jgi:hypothetical protein